MEIGKTFCGRTDGRTHLSFNLLGHRRGDDLKMNLSRVKWAQWDKTQSRELSCLFICVCIALRTTVAHNIAQNRPDNFPSYAPDNHHCSDDVYLSEGEYLTLICLLTTKLLRHSAKDWWIILCTMVSCDLLTGVKSNFTHGFRVTKVSFQCTTFMGFWRILILRVISCWAFQLLSGSVAQPTIMRSSC